MQEFGQPPSSHTQNNRGLGDIGSWLGDTFESIKKNAGAIFFFLYLIPTLASMVVYFAAVSFVSDLRYNRVTETLEGLSLTPVLLLGLAVVVWLIIDLVMALAANHQFYYTQTGQKVSLQESLVGALRNLPRAIGWNLLLYALPVFLMAIMVLAGIWLGVFPFIILVPFLVVSALWALIRLTFLDAVLSMAPKGTNIFSASWELTNRIFWPLLGRIFLIAIIGFVSVVGYELVLDLFYSPSQSARTNVSLSAQGEIVVNGRLLSAMDMIAFKDFLPESSSLFLLSLVGGISGALRLALSAPAMMVLYHRLDGPHE